MQVKYRNAQGYENAIANAGKLMKNPYFTYWLILFVPIILTACEGGGGGDTNTDNNTAPQAIAQSVTVNENGFQALALSGSDVDDDALTYTVQSQPTNGSLGGTAPNLTYTPNANYIGRDSFTFNANDGTLDSNTATVSITVNPANPTNSAPQAAVQSVTVDEDNPIAVTLTGNDANGDTLAFSIAGQPANGSLNGTAPNLTYTPIADYNGSDSFTFKVNDGTVDSVDATVDITINPINDVPLAETQSVTIDQNSSNNTINLTGSDLDGDSLNYTIVSSPSNGTLSGTAPILTYTPTTDYSGSDSFSFRVNDGTIDSSEANVNITITSTPVAPLSPLNDTGITWGANYPSGNNITCIGETIAEQDCSHGRDVTHNDDSDGHAGFSYTKLDDNGNDLPTSVPSWSCVRDNVTGLIWEAKQGGNGTAGDEGLHDADDLYTWYNSDPSTNGGASGADWASALCYGYVDGNNPPPASFCNTQAYVLRVNDASLCGAINWRLPNKSELISLVNHGRSVPAIDVIYFPSTSAVYGYWSASPFANNSNWASNVDFLTGNALVGDRRGKLRVRLVR